MNDRAFLFSAVGVGVIIIGVLLLMGAMYLRGNVTGVADSLIAQTCRNPGVYVVRVHGNSQLSGHIGNPTIDDIRITDKKDAGRGKLPSPFSLGGWLFGEMAEDAAALVRDKGIMEVKAVQNGRLVSTVYATNYQVFTGASIRKTYIIDIYVEDANCNHRADTFTADFMVTLYDVDGDEVAERVETLRYSGS